jgi:hypothetical protein
MTRRWGLVVGLCLAALGAEAATINERLLEYKLSASGMREHVRLTVTIEELGDIPAWSEYSIFTDDDIELVSASIEVVGADGKSVDTLKKRDFRKETSVGFGLHSSRVARIADLPALSVGDRIVIDSTRIHTPLFLAQWDPILLDSPQNKLDIRISGGGEALRWQLRGPDDLVEVEKTDGGIHCWARDLPRKEPRDSAGDTLSVGPALVWAWDKAGGWTEVGAWYAALTDDVSRVTERVRKVAESETADIDGTREKVLALADYARLKIRYEAVEMGVGGWIPTAADQVLQRAWGDCKDKSEFLKTLLGAIGVKAHLVLIHGGRYAMLDPSFPSTLGFNHCILAVETDGFETLASDPVVDGLLFLDPTFDRGVAEWLSPSVQGQWALVADRENARLLKLPVGFSKEGRMLRVRGSLDGEGAFNGVAQVFMSGFRAIGWLRDLDGEPSERIEESVRKYFQHVLPGMTLGNVAWREIEGPVPAFVIETSLSEDRFVRSRRSPRLRVAFLDTLPETRELEDRTEPIVVLPGVNMTEWNLGVPDGWCLPTEEPSNIGNSIGSVLQKVEVDEEGRLVVTRKTLVRRSWIGVESLDHLKELAAVETRLSRGSIRMGCPDPG